MWKTRISALLILIVGIAIGYFVYTSEPKLESAHKLKAPAWFTKFPFKLGLDLSGGTHLIYKADVSRVASAEVSDAMASLRDVIERRVNIFGVSEPIVQVQKAGFANGGEDRLLVDLPGVTDVQKAVEMIGQTPTLEFKTENPDPNAATKPQNATVGPDGVVKIDASSLYDNKYVSTELTGRFLQKAVLEFNQNTGAPIVSLIFNDEGAKLFEQITKANIGKTVAIFLDGAPISTPVVQEAISGGRAQISGTFTPAEAKTLVGRLNSGALPVPIELISTQTIGPSLGEKAINAGLMAGMIGFLAIAIFLVLWYRLPGLIAVLTLSIYISLVLALFKLIPVTLTAAGIAGFIISIGMAVDANVLIFERIKEELRQNSGIRDGIHKGFDRAWLSIRDSNTSSLITSVILFWFGTALIKGFALTFGIGVVISMLSAITFSRLFLYALGIQKSNKITGFLFGSGFSGANASMKK